MAERLTGRRMKRQAMALPVARLGMRLLAGPRDGLASVFGTGVLQDVVTPRWDDAPLRERNIEPRSAREFLESQARTMGFG